MPNTDSRPERDSHRPAQGSALGADASWFPRCRASRALSSSDMRAPTLPLSGRGPRELCRPDAPMELVRFRRKPSPPLFIQGVVGRGGIGPGPSLSPPGRSPAATTRLGRATSALAPPRFIQGVVGRGGICSRPSPSPPPPPAGLSAVADALCELPRCIHGVVGRGGIASSASASVPACRPHRSATHPDHSSPCAGPHDGARRVPWRLGLSSQSAACRGRDAPRTTPLQSNALLPVPEDKCGCP